MKKPSKNIFLATTFCVACSLVNVSVAQEVQPTLVDIKDVSSSQLLKKQRQNKSLALSTVKRAANMSSQNSKQFLGVVCVSGCYDARVR